MELDAAHVERLVAQSHDLSFIAFRNDFKTIGKAVGVDNPRMVSAHGEPLWHVGKQWVVRVGALRRYAMKHVVEILEFPTEHFTDGLMAETHAQHRYLFRITSNDIGQKTGF